MKLDSLALASTRVQALNAVVNAVQNASLVESVAGIQRALSGAQPSATCVQPGTAPQLPQPSLLPSNEEARPPDEVAVATQGPPPQAGGPWSGRLLSLEQVWGEFDQGWDGVLKDKEGKVIMYGKQAPLRDHYINKGGDWKKELQPHVDKVQWCRLQKVVRAIWLHRDEKLDKTSVPSLEEVRKVEKEAVAEMEALMKDGGMSFRKCIEQEWKANITEQKRKRHLEG